MTLTITKRGLLAALAGTAALAALPALAQDAKPVTIGVITTLSTPAGYIGEDVRDAIQLAVDQEGGKLGGVPVKEYGTTDEAYADLAAGRLDAVAGSLPNLTYLVKNRPETFALFEPAQFGKPSYFAWVLRKGDETESFRKAIEDAMKKMTADGRVKAIQEKWLGAYTELPIEPTAN